MMLILILPDYLSGLLSTGFNSSHEIEVQIGTIIFAPNQRNEFKNMQIEAKCILQNW